MALAITDDHVALATTVADFLTRHRSRAVARDLLEAPTAGEPPYLAEAAGLGWLGIHVPEAYGGSGYGLEELVVVAEQLGRGLATGSLVPSMAASAFLAAAAPDATKQRLLPGLADGTLARRPRAVRIRFGERIDDLGVGGRGALR